MLLNFLLLGGYGYFVWPAFILTFTSCFILYLKTRRELLSQEKEFSRLFEISSIEEVKLDKNKKIQKEILTANTY